MDLYNAFESSTGESYLIQGIESTNHLGAQFSDTLEAMYTDGTQEFLVDQGLYYPAATSYGYYCTGFESPVEWEDQQRFFATDGLEVQYAGAQTESFPYVYYTPNYGFAQSAYNPYSPCIPGAVIGVDGPFVGTQHYYTIPAYQNTASSPAYLPVMAHLRPEIPSGGLSDLVAGTGVSVGSRASRHNMNNYPSPGSSSISTTTHMPFLSQMNSFTAVPEGSRIYAGSTRQSANNSGSYPPTESHNLQSRSALASSQRNENISHGNVLAACNQLKTLSLNSGFSDTGLSGHMAADPSKPRAYHGGTLIDGSGNPDALSEQNRGPRVSRLHNQFSVKSYATKIGDCNAQGNIVICADRYNKDDFLVDYFYAKFFVIKSYSEDDVHKSIKYNVWSSTPNGNRKLNIAYEDAQRRAIEGSIQCPVFLFFSVNASGQFCGVAEMMGPVDFYKDMDFWQQDKWNGSFPVKWHFIKDVPNANFRHIILENNENKPVTNSRDTQEVRCQQGMEMLRIFKNYTLKTSLLDDFMYYENRQKTIQEEKMRLTMKNHQGNFYVSREDQAYNGDSVGGSPIVEDCSADIGDNGSTVHGSSELEEKEASTSAQEENINGQAKEGSLSAEEDGTRTATTPDLNVGDLSIDPKQNEVKKPAPSTASGSVDVVTVGSMPVVINGKNEALGLLRVGTIPLDPRALRKDKGRQFSSSKS